MPSIKLSKQDVAKLFKFCVDNKTTWFVAKDQGAYVGASTGQVKNCIFYFPGCDPTHGEFDTWYENCRRGFGGDDFGEQLELKSLEKFAKAGVGMKLTVTKTTITMEQA